ncbi:hypothetical protein AHAS_Ahas02G0168400 [Arachis hypogaea]
MFIITAHLGSPLLHFCRHRRDSIRILCVVWSHLASLLCLSSGCSRVSCFYICSSCASCLCRLPRLSPSSCFSNNNQRKFNLSSATLFIFFKHKIFFFR